VTSVSCCRRGEGWSAPLGPAPHKQMGPSGLNHHPLLPLRFNPASPLTKKAFNLSAPRLLTLCCWLVVVAFHRTGGGRRGACNAARCSQRFARPQQETHATPRKKGYGGGVVTSCAASQCRVHPTSVLYCSALSNAWSKLCLYLQVGMCLAGLATH
jgi:hypothetical protein